jgi:hypothetical protein
LVLRASSGFPSKTTAPLFRIMTRSAIRIAAATFCSTRRAVLARERDGGGFTIVRRYTGKANRIFEVSVTYHLPGEHVFLMELLRQQTDEAIPARPW